jgi:hypothetical protein
MNGENSHRKGPNARAELTSQLYLLRTLFQPLGLKIVAAAPNRSGGPGTQGRRAQGDDDAYRQGIERDRNCSAGRSKNTPDLQFQP